MREIEQADELELQLVVTGMHLSNEFGLTLDEIKAKVAGKRGTKVLLRMMRDETDDGIQNGDIFSLCLKRGSWGPEHCVLEPEDKDMIDQGRWPEPGSVSSQHYDPKAINRK